MRSKKKCTVGCPKKMKKNKNKKIPRELWIVLGYREEYTATQYTELIESGEGYDYNSYGDAVEYVYSEMEEKPLERLAIIKISVVAVGKVATDIELEKL